MHGGSDGPVGAVGLPYTQVPSTCRDPLEADDGKRALQGSGVRPPLLVVRDRSCQRDRSIVSLELSRSYGDAPAPQVHGCDWGRVEVQPPRGRMLLSEVGRDHDKAVIVGHVKQRNLAGFARSATRGLEDEASKTRAHVLGTPTGAHHDPAVDSRKDHVIATATRQ
jgi:IS5 family transposase